MIINNCVKVRTLMQSLRWLERPLLLGLLLSIFCSGIDSVSFHSDESQWIAMSSFFEPFIKGEFDSPVWDESYWHLTQPQLARYIIAIGRLGGGYHSTDLNHPWDHGLSDIININNGNMPSTDLLWWSRLPMAILASFSGLLLFIIIHASSNRLAGYFFLFIFVDNSYLLIMLRRAMGESPLLVFLLLVVFLGIQAISRCQRIIFGAPGYFMSFLRAFVWFMIMAICCGMAGEAKLNGLSSIPLGITLIILVIFLNKNSISKLKCFTLAFCTSVVFILMAGGSFVGWNPYLYPDPLRRTEKMLSNRLHEMQLQQVAASGSRIEGLDTRIKIIGQRIFQDFTIINFPNAKIINLFLCAAGLCHLGSRTWTWFRGDKSQGASIVILLAALTIALPPLFTPLDWDRYYLLPVIFNTIFSALGMAWGTMVLLRLVQRKTGMRLFEGTVFKGDGNVT